MGTMSGVLSSRLDTSMAVAAATASASAATPAKRAVLCELGPRRSRVPARRRPVEPSPEGGKILLQPRLCTLRSYGTGERGALIKMATVREGAADVSSFFASLAEYIESSRRSQDFETVSGRLAMETPYSRRWTYNKLLKQEECVWPSSLVLLPSPGSRVLEPGLVRCSH